MDSMRILGALFVLMMAASASAVVTCGPPANEGKLCDANDQVGSDCLTPSKCSGGLCKPLPRRSGLVCGSLVPGPCVTARTCNNVGVCAPGTPRRVGQKCDPNEADGVCTFAKKCQSNGLCESTGAPKPAGKTCSDTDRFDTVCRAAPRCDGAGSCGPPQPQNLGQICDTNKRCSNAGTCAVGTCTGGTSVITDADNCGVCGNICPNSIPANSQRACISGACGFTCDDGFFKCNGACVACTGACVERQLCAICFGKEDASTSSMDLRCDVGNYITMIQSQTGQFTYNGNPPVPALYDLTATCSNGVSEYTQAGEGGSFEFGPIQMISVANGITGAAVTVNLSGADIASAKSISSAGQTIGETSTGVAPPSVTCTDGAFVGVRAFSTVGGLFQVCFSCKATSATTDAVIRGAAV